MSKYTFSSWIERKFNEWADFGFEKPNIDNKSIESNLPLRPLKIDYIINLLKKHIFGVKYALESTYYGEAQWGLEPGAIKVSFSPFGGIRAIIRKLALDLQGEHKWVCKKVIEVKNYYDENPDSLIVNIMENLEEVDTEGIDSPSSSYDNLEKLVLNMAVYLRRNTTQKILLYQGIRRIAENREYIIHFGCTGMGVQRQDQKRLDQFAIHVTYDPNLGYIKVTGTELGDRIDKHRWQYDPSEFLEYFMPTQSEEKILEAVLIHLNCY